MAEGSYFFRPSIETPKPDAPKKDAAALYLEKFRAKNPQQEPSQPHPAQKALEHLHIDYHGIIPEWEKERYNDSLTRWTEVVTAITENLTAKDAQSENKKARFFFQDTCTAALREHQNWHENIKINGKFLTLIDAGITAARQHNEYYNTDFSSYAYHTIEDLIEDPVTNPLLRRKAEAMTDREIYAWPKDPKVIREVLLKFQRWIYLDGIGGLLGILKENPNYLNQLSETEIIALPEPVLTGDEGITEFLWEKAIRALENPTLRKSSDDTNLVITQIAPGKVGAFDTMGRLIGVRSITENIIHPVEQDPDLARKDIADDIAFTFDISMREQLSKDFGFPLENLTLREQISLIGTFRSITSDEEKQIISTVKTFGLDGARAFLSTEFGDSFRETVLSIAEKFSEDDAKQIFKSFSEIVTFAQETAETLGRRFFADDKSYNADAVRTELLSRAKDLLLAAESSDASSITTKLERFKGDIVLFASMFKVTQKGQEVKFEDIKGVRLESMKATEMEEKDQREMEEIARKNWDIQKPEVTDAVLAGLRQSFKNNKSQFYWLRKEGAIEAFVRFDEKPNGSLYGASFNVADALKSVGIGEAMIHAATDVFAKDHSVDIDVFPELLVGIKYVEDFYCVITGIETVRGKSGKDERKFVLQRDDRKNALYEGKRSPSLLDHSAQLRIEKFDLTKGTDEILNAVERATRRKEVGTRYFVDPTNPAIRYIAFEPRVELTQETSRPVRMPSRENQTSFVQATQ